MISWTILSTSPSGMNSIPGALTRIPKQYGRVHPIIETLPEGSIFFLNRCGLILLNGI